MENINTIYEDDFYIIRKSPEYNHSPFFTTSFTGIGPPEKNNGKYFGYQVSQKLKIPFLGIIAKHDKWYLDGNYAKVFNLASTIYKARPNKTIHIGYGISMGAYAALKHSNFFNFDYVLAMAPQWSLDPSELNFTSPFGNFFSKEMNKMGVKQIDVHSKTYIFYDPNYKADTQEANFFLKNIKSQLVPVCNAGHMVTNSIKSSSVFYQILQNIENHNHIIGIVNHARKQNKENILLIIEKTLHKKKNLTLQALFSKRSIQSGATNSFLSNKEKLWRLARVFAENNLFVEARLFYYYSTNKRKQIIKVPSLLGWNGELLCFCHKNNIFSLTERHIPITGNMVTFVDNNLFSVTPSGLIPINAKINILNNRLIISLNNKYVSARNDNTVSLVDVAKKWEEFIVMPYTDKYLEYFM